MLSTKPRNVKFWITTAHHSPHKSRLFTTFLYSRYHKFDTYRMTVLDSTFIHIHTHTSAQSHKYTWTEPINENSGLNIAHRVWKRQKRRNEKKEERKKISAQVAWSSQFRLKHWSVNTLFTFAIVSSQKNGATKEEEKKGGYLNTLRELSIPHFNLFFRSKNIKSIKIVTVNVYFVLYFFFV